MDSINWLAGQAETQPIPTRVSSAATAAEPGKTSQRIYQEVVHPEKISLRSSRPVPKEPRIEKVDPRLVKIMGRNS
jgi:hypothetical protein